MLKKRVFATNVNVFENTTVITTRLIISLCILFATGTTTTNSTVNIVQDQLFQATDPLFQTVESGPGKLQSFLEALSLKLHHYLVLYLKLHTTI